MDGSFHQAYVSQLPPAAIHSEVDAFQPRDHMLLTAYISQQTIVSMSAHTVHTNVGVWGPDARHFNPDRWLGPDAKKLEQYQVTFSKGNRMCIGQK